MKSTALLFGARTKPILSAFYATAVILIGLAGWTAGAGILFTSGLAAFAAHLAWQIWRLDIDDADRCLALFKSSWSDVARVIGELARYVARNALISCGNFGNAGLGKGTNPPERCLRPVVRLDQRGHRRRRESA